MLKENLSMRGSLKSYLRIHRFILPTNTAIVRQLRGAEKKRKADGLFLSYSGMWKCVSYFVLMLLEHHRSPSKLKTSWRL